MTPAAALCYIAPMPKQPAQPLNSFAIRAAYPLQVREDILEAAKVDILVGRNTLTEIAERYGISRRVLTYWLAQLGEEYYTLRKAWIDNMLADADEALDQVDPQGNKDVEYLKLNKARELIKRAQWYAERRDRQRYGEQAEAKEVAVTVIVNRDKGVECLPVRGDSL